MSAYKTAAEKYFTGIAADPELKVKLTGSWETLIGEGDTFGEWIDVRLRVPVSFLRGLVSSESGDKLARDE